jgi:hypothetical protein
MCDILDPPDSTIEKNSLKALEHLSTTYVNKHNRSIEHQDTEKLAETNDRIAIMPSIAKQISEQLEVPEEYIKITGAKHAKRIVQAQLNLDIIVDRTMNRLQDEQPSETSPDSQTKNISDDWLNQFRDIACKKSSEDARDLFSRILEGEIRKPESLSLRTLTTLADMDQKVVSLFNTFCSLCVIKLEDPNAFLKSPSNFKINVARAPIIRGTINDAGTLPKHSNPDMDKSAQKSQSIYQKYGFGFSEFQLLVEYGLIQDDTFSDYSYFWYNNEIWAILKPTSNFPKTTEDLQKISISGFNLSSVGRELFHIRKPNNPPEYLEEIIDFLQEYYNVKIVKVSRS